MCWSATSIVDASPAVAGGSSITADWGIADGWAGAVLVLNACLEANGSLAEQKDLRCARLLLCPEHCATLGALWLRFISGVDDLLGVSVARSALAFTGSVIGPCTVANCFRTAASAASSLMRLPDANNFSSVVGRSETRFPAARRFLVPSIAQELAVTVVWLGRGCTTRDMPRGGDATARKPLGIVMGIGVVGDGNVLADEGTACFCEDDVTTGNCSVGTGSGHPHAVTLGQGWGM